MNANIITVSLNTILDDVGDVKGTILNPADYARVVDPIIINALTDIRWEIADGHKRTAGLQAYCTEMGIDPADVKVNVVQILDPDLCGRLGDASSPDDQDDAIEALHKTLNIRGW